MALAGRPSKRRATARVIFDTGELVALELDNADALPTDGEPRRVTAFCRPRLSRTEFAASLRKLADLVKVGEALTPFVTKLAELGGVLASNTTLLKVGAAVLGTFVTAVYSMKVITSVTNTVRDFGVAMKALNLEFMTSPIGITVTALAALGVAFYEAWKRSATFRAIVTGVFADVKTVALDFVHFFTQKIPAAVQTVISWVKGHWPLLLAALGGGVGIAVLEIIRHFDTIKTKFTDIIDWFKGLPAVFLKFGEAIGSAIVHGLVSAVSGLGAALTGIIKGAVGHIPGATSVLHVLHVPGFATGGIVGGPIGAPTLAVVHGGETVIPAGSGARGGGGGGVALTVNLNGPVFGDKAKVAHEIADEIATALRGGRVPTLADAVRAA